jgi:hypothetical protein
MSSTPLTFRFRPRFRGLALAAIGLGAALLGLAVGLPLAGPSLAFALGCGAIGIGLGALYLGSPAWRFRAMVDDDALEVLDHHGDRKFRLAWRDVARVVASPATETLMLTDGSPERTLIIPGEGAQAPYDIEHKAALYRAVLARVPADRVVEVALLAGYQSERANS